jgi:cytochrome c peroxidase
LGRYLFYETLLSKDNTISCGSCHQPFVAFAQADHPVSHGIHDQEGRRNSPALFNLAWLPYFMHDGAINHIEVQPLGPINNPIEMGEETGHVVAKLQASEKYRNLFKKAYGDSLVSSDRMLKCIAQFMGLLLSNQSKYDRMKEGDAKFTAQETNGYNLFIAKCSSCHTEPLFTDYKFRNNGLSIDTSYKDGGRGALKLDEPQNLYCFKTPSLRNIAKTAPYMHDGRLSTLQECLDHYTNGIVNKTNLDPLLTNGIPMTDAEKQDILSFLNTLTDFEFITNPQFKDPNFK